jgi:hypothetical protein
VVLALLSLMVLVAADLIVHSLKLLGAVGRAARNPLVVQVNERLRRDVQEAAWLLGGEEIWSEGPLILGGHEGGRLRLALVDGELVRAGEDASGGAVERVLLRGVTAWWWRSPAPGVVDISYTHLTAPPPESRVPTESGFELERRTETLRFAIRGGGGGWRW